MCAIQSLSSLPGQSVEIRLTGDLALTRYLCAKSRIVVTHGAVLLRYSDPTLARLCAPSPHREVVVREGESYALTTRGMVRFEASRRGYGGDAACCVIVLPAAGYDLVRLWTVVSSWLTSHWPRVAGFVRQRRQSVARQKTHGQSD
jgi:hypothetical protein